MRQALVADGMPAEVDSENVTAFFQVRKPPSADLAVPELHALRRGHLLQVSQSLVGCLTNEGPAEGD